MKIENKLLKIFLRFLIITGVFGVFTFTAFAEETSYTYTNQEQDKSHLTQSVE